VAAEIDLFNDIINERLVRSLTNEESFQFGTFHQGSKLSIRYWPLIPTYATRGAKFTKVGIHDLDIKVGLGPRAGGEGLLAAQFASSKVYDPGSPTGYIFFDLDLNTVAMNNAIGITDSLTTWFEIVLIDNGIPRVVYQQQVTVFAVVFDPAGVSVLPLGASFYFTSAEMDNQFVKWNNSHVGSRGKTVTLYSPDGTAIRIIGVRYDGSAQDDLLFHLDLPYDYTPLLAWWDASQLTYADNTPIDNASAMFLDRSGNANHALQASAPDRPLLRTAIINGKNVVRFDGITSKLSFSPLAFAADFTFIFIGTAIGDSMILGNAASNIQVRRNRSGANTMSNYYGSSDIVSLALTGASTNVHMCVWRRTGILIKHRENKTDKTGVIPTDPPSDGSTFTLDDMGHYWIANYLTGDVGEILVYGSFISDAALDALYDDYFKPKWGLP